MVDILVDGYIFRVIRKRLKESRKWNIIHISLAALLFIAIGVALLMPRRSGTDGQLLTIMWLLYAYLSVYIPKILFVIIDLIARIPVLFKRRRLKWLTRAGAGAALLIFISMWWGALLNRYNLDVKIVDIEIPDLPKSFENYTIVQISDLHVGSYGKDTTFVKQLVDEINFLEPEMIVFTGDIVNRKTSELIPFMESLSKLTAPDGVISVLGNHDYGDYASWKSEADKQANLDRMIKCQREMGWKLLLNETEFIHRGEDSIAIIGVENIGDPPFHSYGDLNKAYPTLNDSVVKILLSHNPAHWQADIRRNPDVNIPLTLSGHTHAMQFAMGGLSPARLRYKYWGGLYDDGGVTNNRLYVNIGIGTVGFPARIGATPEITIFKLTKGK